MLSGSLSPLAWVNGESEPESTDDGEQDDDGRPRAPRAESALEASEPVVTSSGEAGEDKPKKRGGWWQRRGFF